MTIPRPSRLGRMLLKLAGGAALAVFVIAAAVLGVYYWLFVTVPAPMRLALGDTRVVTADGTVLAVFLAQEHAQPVAYSSISPAAVQAVVAKEDARFFEHDGVDYGALIRAAIADVKARKVVQGGSTITQQYVKTTLDDRSRSLTRKVRELLIARKVEGALSKEEIITRYLNSVYFGRGAYGIEAAARRYFAVEATQLDYPKAALLAVLISAPSLKDSSVEPAELKAQRDALLKRMVELGYIAPSGLKAAQDTPLGIVADRGEKDVRLPYVVDFLKKELLEVLPAEVAYGGGLTIETSIDPRLQAYAELAAYGRLPDTEGLAVALVSVEPSTGLIRTMVAGRDYAKSQFNLATQAHRQPGSAFKPFVLAAALEQGYDPQTTTFLGATPFTVSYRDATSGLDRSWSVSNYEDESYGMVNLVEATVHSVNTVYAQLITKLGADKVADLAKRAGITSPLRADPAIALGGLSVGVSPLEMASAYATFANDGYRVEPHIISRITDSEGAVIYHSPHKEQPVFSPDVAFGVTQILQEVVRRGTGFRARLDRPVAGKTGTSQGFRDAWFIGYTPQLSTAVWMGYPDAARSMEETLGKVAGGTIPAQMWHDFTSAALEGKDAVPFRRIDVVMVSICRASMKLSVPACPDKEVLALEKNQVPTEYCDMHK